MTHGSTGPQPAAQPPGSRPAPLAAPLVAMRVVVTLHALAVFAQPVLAGLFLSGNFDMLLVHGVNAQLVHLFALFQIPAAVLLRWPGRGPLWPLPVSIILFLAGFAQAAAGYVRVLSVHVPLGVAIFGTVLVVLVWVWRPRLGAPRPGPTASEAVSHAPVTS